MPLNKEKKAAYMKIYMKTYNQTSTGKKTKRISNWKKRGILVESNNYDKFYDVYLKITNCQLCEKILTTDKYHTHSTRCVDHDHLINDKPNVRAICCHACNVNDKLNNTSGEPNIHYHKNNNNWAFKQIIQGKKYAKAGFKTKAEAIQYKYQFLSTLA